MSEMLKTPVETAAELSRVLDRTLDQFMRDHAPLVRAACDAPPELGDLSEVVICTFLGHTVDQLRRARGRAHVQTLVSRLLDQLEQVDATVNLRGTFDARAGRLQ